MARPLIGVAPLVDYGRESLWMLPGYFDGLFEGEGIPFMLPLTANPDDVERFAELFDGFLLTGGQDVEPAVYGETPLSVCGETSPERDRMEAALLDMALRLDKPVLGICRGIQFLNAHLGGTLYQDLPAQRPSDIRHRQSAPYDRPSHTVEIVFGTPLYELIRADVMDVNSCHHQAIRDLAPDLLPMAWSEDGLVEAVYMPARDFVWGVQWHPEFSHKVDLNSRKIFRAFVRACTE